MPTATFPRALLLTCLALTVSAPAALASDLTVQDVDDAYPDAWDAAGETYEAATAAYGQGWADAQQAYADAGAAAQAQAEAGWTAVDGGTSTAWGALGEGEQNDEGTHGQASAGAATWQA